MKGKKNYSKPEIEVISLLKTNIITCSGPWEEIEHELDPNVWD